MDYSVRPYCDCDAEKLHAITLAAIRIVGRAGYSEEQVEAWAAAHGSPVQLRARVAAGHVIFVAVDSSDSPAALALIEPDGHLDQLYCHPEHTRRGLAKCVLLAAENHARSHGVEKLYTEASELARPAFERAGYVVIQRRDFEIIHRERRVPIHNYAMEKLLI